MRRTQRDADGLGPGSSEVLTESLSRARRSSCSGSCSAISTAARAFSLLRRAALSFLVTWVTFLATTFRLPLQSVEMRRGYWVAGAVAGAQKRSKAVVSSSAMLPGSRLSMSRRSSMKTTLPSRISATEGDDGA